MATNSERIARGDEPFTYRLACGGARGLLPLLSETGTPPGVNVTAPVPHWRLIPSWYW